MSPDPLAEKLRSLLPAPTALNRDQLLFEAGRRAATPATGWKLSTLAACVLAVGTMSLHYLSPVERVVYVSVPQTPPAELVAMPPITFVPESQPVSAWSLYQLRKQTLQSNKFVPPALPPEDKAPQPLTVGSSLTFHPAP
jgi:hypothetical protein